ncbi:hypothetical protein ILYODFUR_030595 [Ilyodon furcidens]|uniref:Uncharacterized protein n=1 Tax=Ilyodon furcidens TaxID=33524 RepID=A0ABV0UZG6_9TELE
MKRLKELHPLTFTFPSHRKYCWISASVFFVCLCSVLSNPPVGHGRWPLTLSLVLLEVSSCEKGVFPVHCGYMHAQYEGLLQSQPQCLSTVATCSSKSHTSL